MASCAPVLAPDEFVVGRVVRIDVQVLAGVEQRLDVLSGEHRPGPDHVEFVVPLRDEQGGHRVADEVDQRPALGHELVDAEDQHDADDRDVPDRAQSGCQGDESAAGDAGRTLGGQQHDREQADLLADREVGVGGLGDVQRRERQVDRGTVEVEAVAGRTTSPTVAC